MDQPAPPPPPIVLDGYKKLLAAVIAIVAWVAGRWGLDINQADLAGMLTPIMVYIVAQGWADTGKHAAQVHARTDAASNDTTAALVAEIAELRKAMQAAGIATSPSIAITAPPFTTPKEPT